MKPSRSITNFLWRVIEVCSSQIVTFLVSVVLARLISPEDYGTLAIVSVFISLCSIFIDSGFGMALVQKKDADDLDFSSVFYFNIFMCVLLYIIIFLCSPLIASLYELPALTTIIRVQSITLLISGVRSIQNAYVARNLLFKRAFFSTVGSTLSSAAVGIGMAYAGYGIWALIGQSLVSSIVGTVIIWLVIKWRPKRIFSFARVKEMFSFASKLLVSSLINVGYNDLRQLIIGKFYTTSDLAFFNRGASLPGLFNNVISNGANSVLLPTMSTAQDSKEAVRELVRKSIRIQSYVLMPVFAGLAVCADSLIRVLFTDVWREAASFQIIFCGMYFFESVVGTNFNAYKAMGYSGITLKLECFKTPLYTAILLLVMPYGTKAIAIGSLIGCLIGSIVCLLPAKKVYDYSIRQQLKDVLPHILLSAAMVLCVYLVSLLPLSGIAALALQVFTGAATYILLSIIFKMECFHYVKNQLLSFVKR